MIYIGREKERERERETHTHFRYLCMSEIWMCIYNRKKIIMKVYEKLR